ncbi:MAG: mandelate racemase [Betaproteobacteria bacterium]|nr:mandelate racemase [Betaproteobacteria bacterium]
MHRFERIRLHRLEVPLRTPYKLAFGLLRHFDTLLVEVQDSEGRTGLGEATVLTGYTEETVEEAWGRMRAWAQEVAALDPAAARELLLKRVDQAPFAVSGLVTAIEMMLGDELLSVSAAARVPLLGMVNAESGAALDAEIDSLLGRGFRTLKVKVGFDAAEDAKRLREIQSVVAGRASIRVDANQGFSREDALRFASGIEPAGIELLEQPCAAGDWDSACAVARVSTVPMMLDESIYGLPDIRRAAQLGAARFIKLKLMKLGSLRRLAEGIALIRSLGMEPVLGNGVACEIGCWMEALVARTGITNAGEMNGYLKQSVPLLANPPRFNAGAIELEPGYRPEPDRNAIARLARDSMEFAGGRLVTT